MSQILLADDYEVVRAGIRTVVEEIPGLTVIGEVSDGPALVENLERLQPDCLLVDISLPDFIPVENIAAIRSKYPDLKILVVTTYYDEFCFRGLLKIGVHGYHLKQQPLSELKMAIQRVLKGERWISYPILYKLIEGGVQNPSQSLLTTRQRDILRLLQKGLANQSIATEMSLSIKTVENHLTRIYRLLGVQSRLEAVAYVNRHPEQLGAIEREAFSNRDIRRLSVASRR